MNRLSLILMLVSTASACCYVATGEIGDGGQATGSSGTSSGGSSGGSSTSGGSTGGGRSGSTGGSSGGSSGGSTGGSGGQCEMPTPGSCSNDSDCIVAYCSDWACNCGGWVIATSQLGQPGANACLIEDGAAVPAGCEPQGEPCNCPVHPICTPQCDAGTCACDLTCGNGETLCNGECADTSGDIDNCGTCGNACTSGQECLNGVCSPSSPGGSGSGGCSETDFCACTNFCVSTCRCGDGGCPLTQACEGARCPNSCPSGEACSFQSGDVFMCSPLCTPDGIDGQGSCQAGMTCQTVCT